VTGKLDSSPSERPVMRRLMASREPATTLSPDEKKIEVKKAPDQSMVLKDVIILVHSVIILLLISIIFCKIN
jgi:hypothetical protein